MTQGRFASQPDYKDQREGREGALPGCRRSPGNLPSRKFAGAKTRTPVTQEKSKDMSPQILRHVSTSTRKANHARTTDNVQQEAFVDVCDELMDNLRKRCIHDMIGVLFVDLGGNRDFFYITAQQRVEELGAPV